MEVRLRQFSSTTQPAYSKACGVGGHDGMDTFRGWKHVPSQTISQKNGVQN